MNRRHPDQHRGVTLLELLVVIAIIGILVSLLLAGVQRVRDAQVRTENGDRIAQIGQAIGNAKLKLNLTQIPAGLLPNYSFTLKGRYNGNEPELEYLLAAFPQMNTAMNSNQDNGYTGPDVVLDANQTLMLFLTGGTATQFTGFSTNSKRPFEIGNAGDSRKGPYLEGVNQKWYRLDISKTPAQAWLVDKYDVPFAYFASLKGKLGAYPPDQSFSWVDPEPPAVPLSTVKAFRSNGKYLNEQGFQIISAGKDRQFGAGDMVIPGQGVGADDQANFTKSTLSGGLN